MVISLLFASKNVNATPDWDPRDISLSGKYIKISITYKDYSGVDSLYYKSLLENLDNFINSLKQKGKLSRGKIHFNILKETWHQYAYAAVSMSMDEKGYHCALNSFYQNITQDYLTKLIAYFASYNWEPFCPEDTENYINMYYEDVKQIQNSAINVLNRKIDPIKDPIKILHKYVPRKVLDAGNGIAVYFQNDSLICKGKNKVYGKIKYLLPFSVGSKSFITIGETIYVVEKGNVINQIQLTVEDFGGWDNSDPSKEVFPEYVNFINSSGHFLSYSIAENKFYKIEQD